MKKRALSVFLTLVMVLSPFQVAHAATQAAPKGSDVFQEPASLSEAERQVWAAIVALRSDYPEGMPWTNADSYRSEALSKTGRGCAGFAYICSDAAFGNAPIIETHSDFDRIRVGDMLRINHDTHTVVVLEKRAESVIVAEGNYNHSIHWGREISRAALEAGDMVVSTRWSDGDPQQEVDPATPVSPSSDQPITPDPAVISMKFPKTLFASSDNVTAFVNGKGELFTCGFNSSYVLGYQETDAVEDLNILDSRLGNITGLTSGVQTVFKKVTDDVASFSLSSSHAAAVKNDGSLWLWGGNGSGQLGFEGGDHSFVNYKGKTETYQAVPRKLMDDVSMVSCGPNYTAAVKKDGSLWVWGFNFDGQLGDGTKTANMTPHKLMDDVVTVSCGQILCAAVKRDGSLWTWGRNYYGSLGIEDPDEKLLTPQKIMDSGAAYVTCGSSSSAVIKTDGSLWTWGHNLNGSLGMGIKEEKAVPHPQKILDDVVCVSLPSSSGLYACAVQKDGSLWVWGDNPTGQLGFSGGNATSGGWPIQTTPHKLMDGVAQASIGSCGVALKKDGSYWAWGYDNYGQQGRGSHVDGRPYKPSMVIADLMAYPGDASTSSPPRLAYASTQSVRVDGKRVTFPCYALKDADGNMTNYIKLRDLALALNGSAAQFQVGWDGNVTITTGAAYTPNGTEQTTPYSGDRACQEACASTKVNGRAADLDAFVLTDDQGGGYTYYQLRDLGRTLGFNVGWSADKGMFLETDKPYDPAN